MCTHHSCSITTDHALMTTILDATAVKTSAQKCFRCGSFDHLVDRCSFPLDALLEMAEITKKGIQVKQTAKSGPFKSNSPIQTDKWFHNGREGCNNYQQDRCTSPAANMLTSVAAVSRSTLLPNVVPVVQSPLHLNNLHKYLSNHPDQVWCSKLLKDINHGMNIGFVGKRTSIVSDNWKSALDHT